jgi:hypothetical protein
VPVSFTGGGIFSTVQSSGDTMYIIFETDDTLVKKGFNISYILEGAPTSTIGTTVVAAAGNHLTTHAISAYYH